MTTKRRQRRSVVKGPNIARNVGRLGTLKGRIRSPRTKTKPYPYAKRRY
jgi:hypothetical protein